MPGLLTSSAKGQPSPHDGFSSRTSELTPWQQWVKRPQGLWIRKALFQVHLWAGVGVGLYVLLISISGSALVYRQELLKKYSRQAIVVAGSQRMSLEELKLTVQRTYPGYEVYSVFEPQRPDAPDRIVLGDDKKRILHLFDPYTGADLGDPRSFVQRVIQKLVDLHDNLLAGQDGRSVNGLGAFFITLLGLTGLVIWWPGARNWRRSLTVSPKTSLVRFNWDLHSAMGIWCSAFVLVWGLSGFCLCFPGVLDPVLGRHLLSWIARLHFGRFNRLTEAIWTILGLVPATLSFTGALMWWNRVLRKEFTHRGWLSSR